MKDKFPPKLPRFAKVLIMYPTSSQLSDALETLFDDSSIAQGLLGHGSDLLPSSDKEEPFSPNMSADNRARSLRNKLENYVVQMAEEVNELGTDELPRLRAETTATLVVLRELQNYFPEAFVEG